MAIFFGSLNHTTSGRKRNSPQKRTKSAAIYKEYSNRPEPYRRETPAYQSVDMAKANHTLVGLDIAVLEKRMISSKYTIAPAYNKGAYQVISRENVKDIGK
jgi:hypothetical protein